MLRWFYAGVSRAAIAIKPVGRSHPQRQIRSRSAAGREQPFEEVREFQVCLVRLRQLPLPKLHRPQSLTERRRQRISATHEAEKRRTRFPEICDLVTRTAASHRASTNANELGDSLRIRELDAFKRQIS